MLVEYGTLQSEAVYGRWEKDYNLVSSENSCCKDNDYGYEAYLSSYSFSMRVIYTARQLWSFYQNAACFLECFLHSPCVDQYS